MRSIPTRWLFFVLLLAGPSALAAEKPWPAPASAREPGPTVRVAFVGDVMLAEDRVPGRLAIRGEDPFEGVAALLSQAHIVLGNLECVVASSGEAEDKSYTFRADPTCMPVLTRHLTAVCLANNHTGDFGKPALVEMLERLEKANLPAFGAGRNSRQARAPLALEQNGIRIAFLGYNGFHPRSFEASPDTPGIAWCVEEQMIADVREARKRADVVIPFLHLGYEYEPEPNDEQKRLAHALIDAGAAIVVGGHPHVTQGTEIHKDCPIVYSLGNFVFDDFNEADGTVDPKEHCRLGWLLRLTLDRRGVVAWDTITTRTDDRGFPQPISTKAATGNRSPVSSGPGRTSEPAPGSLTPVSR